MRGEQKTGGGQEVNPLVLQDWQPDFNYKNLSPVKKEF
jgi:hypothetical protein